MYVKTEFNTQSTNLCGHQQNPFGKSMKFHPHKNKLFHSTFVDTET